MEYAEGGSLYNGESTCCAGEQHCYIATDDVCSTLLVVLWTQPCTDMRSSPVQLTLPLFACSVTCPIPETCCIALFVPVLNIQMDLVNHDMKQTAVMSGTGMFWAVPESSLLFTAVGPIFVILMLRFINHFSKSKVQYYDNNSIKLTVYSPTCRVYKQKKH